MSDAIHVDGWRLALSQRGKPYARNSDRTGRTDGRVSSSNIGDVKATRVGVRIYRRYVAFERTASLVHLEAGAREQDQVRVLDHPLTKVVR